METVREQLVSKPVGQSDGMIKICIAAAAAMIAGLAFIFCTLLGGIFIMIGILFSVLVLWLGYYLIGLRNVEYEYCIAGSEFSIDKITNQSKRKTLCSFNLRNAVGFYKTKKALQDATVISAEGNGDIYSIEYKDPKYGKTVVYFTPDERTLEMITPYLPRLS